MKYYLYIFGLFGVMVVSVASSDMADKNTKWTNREDAALDKSIDKRQGGYSNNIQNANQYNVNPYQYDYKGYQNQYWNGQSLSDYDSGENKEAVDEAFTSGGLDRQDLFGDDMMSMFAVALAAFAAGAASYALIQNANQESEFDSVKSRLSSLESDQTSICTSVTALTNADSGLTSIGNGVYNTDGTGEQAYLVNLAKVANPTCS